MRKISTDYDLPLAEFLTLLENIRSSHGGDIPPRTILPRVMLSCAFCGKEFIRPAYEVTKHIKKGLTDFYCCKEHSQAHLAVKNSKTCPGCGKIIRLSGRTKGAKTCPDCAAMFKKPSNPRYPAIEKTCPVCNRTFMAVHRRRGQYAIYCCKRCAEIGHSWAMSGQGNPHWRDGMTPLREQPHCARAYREMRPLVIARDGNACALCGAAEQRIEVHHIDWHPMNNAAVNLITLCTQCHRKLHGMPWEQYQAEALPKLTAYTGQFAVSMTSN